MTIVLCFYIRADSSGLFISFLDVGQGDSIYIQYKDNRILVDTGYNYEANKNINKYLPFYSCHLSDMFLTHPDYDHIGGAIRILQQCDVGRVRINDVDCVSTTCKKLSEFLEDINVENNLSGDVIEIDFFKLKTLWPSRKMILEENPSNINDVSIVQILKYGEFDVLLTGDAGFLPLKKIQENILDEVTGRLDILKLPHHGSITGLAAALFTKLDPKYCIISAGIDNPYGHPDEEVIEFLHTLNCEILSTSELGSIEFKVH